MKTHRIVLISLVSAVIGGLIAVFISNYQNKKELITRSTPTVENVRLAQNVMSDTNITDFTVAAEKSVDAVVHVMTAYSYDNEYSGNPLFDFFFGQRNYSNPEPVVGSGSGVILSRDGFIVTNNHVIDKAQEIKVILNDKRTFDAKLVGSDPNTDIALLKINANDLPFISFGNSDNLKLGEWVLAIGNPFNLTSTVTAGIVSAKARNIQINDNRFAIESFIQTDAAVNPGNSGGALVNLKGELVGINTAIASRTGSYAGYSFAIPSSIAKKIVTDLIEFGEVQRAILGVNLDELDSDYANKNGITEMKGVLITGIAKGGAAEQTGLKVGDIILDINGTQVNTVAQVQEQISKYRPNQQVELIINRNNNKKHFTATLRNMKGGLEEVNSSESIKQLGASFQELNSSQKSDLGIRYGIQVVSLTDGALKKSGIKEGYIIVKINRVPIKNLDDLKRVISISSGGTLLEGVYPNGVVVNYAINLN